MNFQFYLEKLHGSNQYKNFVKQNPDAYFCSGFFVIDKEGNDNKIHFDYFLPSEKKIISFQMEEGIQQIPVQMIDKREPNKVSASHDFDFEDVEKMINDKMQEQGVGSKIQKIIFSLQKVDGKDYLVGTVFVSKLGMLKIHIGLAEMKITLFEKKSFFDMVKVLKKDKK